MKAVLQRVREASVAINGNTTVSIGPGLVVLLGVATGDAESDAEWMINRILTLRVFPGDRRPIDQSLLDVGGALLLLSQFTLLADTTKGRRPNFLGAADPVTARVLYERCITLARERGATVATGEFGSAMAVSLVNDGPVTIILDSRQ